MSLASPLVRQWILLRVLCARQSGATVQDLAAELEVCDKTVRRDLEALHAAGFPLEHKAGEFGRKHWRMAASWQPGDIRFTFEEALALYLGRRQLEPLAGTLIWESAQRAYQKIQATLSDSVLRYVEKIGESFHQTAFGSSDYGRHSEILDQLLVGIEDRRATFITYQSQQATEPVTYDIYPYGITFHRGALYLIGYAPRHEELRHWKVNRIEGAEVTEVRFQRPADFHLQRHLAQSLGVFRGDGDLIVRVHFSREVSRYVREANWHSSQKLTSQRDGSLHAEFRLSSTLEVKSWVLSFGRHAEVLEPNELRDEIAQDLRTLVTRYGANGNSHPDKSSSRRRLRTSPRSIDHD